MEMMPFSVSPFFPPDFSLFLCPFLFLLSCECVQGYLVKRNESFQFVLISLTVKFVIRGLADMDRCSFGAFLSCEICPFTECFSRHDFVHIHLFRVLINKYTDSLILSSLFSHLFACSLIHSCIFLIVCVLINK